MKFGFENDMITLRVDQLVPLKLVPPNMRVTDKYKQILASIKQVGIIEPPVVNHDAQAKDRHLLLDGHLRIEALKELGETEVLCLVSTDDESFTYNKHINRLSTIQEHRMIMRAMDRGVPEDKIAKALNIQVGSIVRKRTLLDGICAEAVDLLKDKMVAGGVFPLLKKMNAMRQIEVAELMNDAGIYSISYVKAALVSTPREQLTDPSKPKKLKGFTDEQITRMEAEMAKCEREYRLVEESYGEDVLSLTLAKGYLGSLLGNAPVVRHMAQHHAAILRQFQNITEMTTLNIKT
jgi:hypothetical protein